MPKDFALKIKELRRFSGLTQRTLAEKLGVLSYAVSSWEQGRWEPSGEHYAQLARMAPPELALFFLNKIGIDTEMLRALQRELKAPASELRIKTAEKWRAGAEERLRSQTELPVVKDEAAAGLSREIDRSDIDSFITIPSKLVPKGPEEYTGIYHRGDAMAPILRDGFLVVVDHGRRDPVRLRGRMVAALAPDGVQIRWLARESRPGRIILRSENPSYGEIVIRSPGTESIIGDVVFWWGVQAASADGRR